MIKKVLIFFALFCAFIISVGAEELPQVSAKAAVLLSADSGEVIYGKNEHEKLSMASTTKIMTSLLTVESNTPERVITVSKEMVSIEGTSMGLKPGDRVSYEGLVYGMLLESGNDAANSAAYALSGSPKNFALRMNEKARRIGMKNTNFVTPSGLDDENHYSTAYDMALLGAYAIKNPEFRAVCSSSTKKVEYGNPPYSRRLSNHNRLLNAYEGAIGIKTGFTKKSGRCLVSAAERDGVTLIAVTLNAPDDWNDHKKLFDYGFAVMKKEVRTPDVSSLTVNIIGGDKKSIGVALAGEAWDIYYKTPADSCIIELRPFEYAPVKAGDVLGCAVFSRGGKEISRVEITAAESTECITTEAIKEKKENPFKKLWMYIKKLFSRRNQND